MAHDANVYLTLAGLSQGEYKEKGSRFLGYATGVASAAEAGNFLQQLRQEHPKARHFCYAWRFGTDGCLFRANDDQEPSGSAGKPILGQIDSAGLTQVLVVVVRYFGGTKLGVPGLIHAYKSAAAEAISHGVVLRKEILDAYRIQLTLARMGDGERLFKQAGAEVLQRSFGPSNASFSVLLPRAAASALLAKLQTLDYQVLWELLPEDAGQT
jgi:uncharacterized YigZ family protein